MKRLPCGTHFYLGLNTPRLLHHKSELGEFFLSSDQIGNTYSNVKKMSHIIEEIPVDDMDYFESLRATISGHAFFPAKRIDNKMTINGARGVSHQIKDRFDLTLECIRRFYLGEESPLSDVLKRNGPFFQLFDDFKGYVDFFLYQDLVGSDYSSIKFWLPFLNFENPALPQTVEEYIHYKSKVIDFLNARNQRIKSYGDKWVFDYEAAEERGERDAQSPQSRALVARVLERIKNRER